MAVSLKRQTISPTTTPQRKYRLKLIALKTHISLTELDNSDDQEKETDTMPIDDKITWLKSRLAELNLLKDKVEEHPNKLISTIDPDSKLMPTSVMQTKVCYNLQSEVDCKHRAYSAEADVALRFVECFMKATCTKNAIPRKIRR